MSWQDKEGNELNFQKGPSHQFSYSIEIYEWVNPSLFSIFSISGFLKDACVTKILTLLDDVIQVLLTVPLCSLSVSLYT